MADSTFNFTLNSFPPVVPNREEFTKFEDLYAGRTIGSPNNILVPNPDLTEIVNQNQKEIAKVRSNLTADIANSIASLVVGDGVEVNTNNTDIDLILETTGFDNTVLTIAETASVYGGAYIKANYTPSLSPVPTFTVLPPTNTAPLFREGVLLSVSFWDTIRIDGNTIYRWVEHRDNVTRTLTNSLYKGSVSTWGDKVSLDAIPETNGLPESQKYPAGVARLVWYVPNLLPNRLHPTSSQGRSDFSGSQSLLASADLLYTSLIRDFRLGPARAYVPVGALTRTNNSGSYFETDREIFTELDIDPSSESGKITLLQGNIRSDEHISSIENLVARIVSAAGLSPVSFGIGDLGSAQSGTALRVREGKTISTINAKRRYMAPVLVDIVQCLASLVGKTVTDVSVDFPPVRTETGSELATMLRDLATSGIISTEEAVRQLHPHWTETQIQDEVAQIQETIASKQPVTPSTASSNLMPMDNPTPDVQTPTDTPTTL